MATSLTPSPGLIQLMCQKQPNVGLKEKWVQTGESKPAGKAGTGSGQRGAVDVDTEMPFYPFLPPF